jgi:hypothetical protein
MAQGAQDQPDARSQPTGSGHDAGRVVLRASVPLALRSLGIASVSLGVLVVAALLAGGLLEGAARTFVLVLLGVLALPIAGALLTAVARLLGWGARFVHSAAGFENRTSWLGVGRRRATWPEVTSLREMRDVLVIDLGPDARSLVDCRVLGRSPASVGEEIRPYVGRPLR